SSRGEVGGNRAIEPREGAFLGFSEGSADQLVFFECQLEENSPVPGGVIQGEVSRKRRDDALAPGEVHGSNRGGAVRNLVEPDLVASRRPSVLPRNPQDLSLVTGQVRYEAVTRVPFQRQPTGPLAEGDQAAVARDERPVN